jgi:hypothetical protein
MRRSWIALLPLLCCSCAVTNAIDTLAERSPPPEFGRPAWVRTFAGVGAWAGAVVGGVVTVVLLPVTWPLSEIAGEGLGKSKDNVMLFPALTCAAAGHALFGLPVDFVDYSCRRMWVDATPMPANTYELIPLDAASLPAPTPPAAAPSAPANKQ